MPEDDRAIVIDCPVCHRTIWSWTVCLHGAVPPPGPDAPAEPTPAPPAPALVPPAGPRTFPPKPKKPPKV